MTDELEPPQVVVADRVHTLVKAVVAGAPMVGGPAAELFGAIVPTSLERRRQAWFERVAERLRRLEERGIHLTDLSTDEGFVTIVVEATKAALGTHLEEKLELLANCIESAALPDGRDDFMAMRLLQFVEELSPEHFVLLTYLRDPADWFERKGLAKPNIYTGAPRGLLDDAQLGVEGDVLEIVLRDVSDRGLANTGSMNSMMTERGVWQSMATDLGRLLLDFVQII